MFAKPIDYSQALAVFSFAVEFHFVNQKRNSGHSSYMDLVHQSEFCVVVRMLGDIVWQAREPAGDAVLAKNLRIYTHFNSLSLTPDT